MQTKQTVTPSAATPLVSFVIAYYDLPVDMLCECIDSVLALSLNKAEREIIVVDDGSPYSPMNDLMKYGDDIVYIRQKNSGLSMARNTGIRMASGQYIQFVDGDDKLNRTPYERCLDTVRYSSPDMVVFDFSNTECATAEYGSMDGPESGTEYLKRHNLRATAWGYIFSKAILGSLRFTPGIYHEDEEFTPQLMLRAEKVYSTADKAYMYRKRHGSITTDKSPRNVLKRLDDSMNVILRLQTVADTLPYNDSLAMRRRTAQLTMDYIYNAITLTRSPSFVKKKIDELSRNGLFPLPDRDYTRKYKWFRRMTATPMGLNILMRTLPLLKKER